MIILIVQIFLDLRITKIIRKKCDSQQQHLGVTGFGGSKILVIPGDMPGMDVPTAALCSPASALGDCLQCLLGRKASGCRVYRV